MFATVLVALALVAALPAPTRADFQQIKACLLDSGTSLANIIEPDSEAYLEANYQWQRRGGFTAPIGYVTPGSAAEIQNAVKCGRQLNRRLTPLSGGHSYAKYSFGDNATFILDLQKLQSIQVNEAAGSVKVGAGALLGPLYWQLWNQGEYLIPGGTCATVGISGFTTGGGYSVFSRQLGLGIDSVLEIEVVTADASLLVCNEEQNADMFWALRGAGGGSFGVISSFVFKLHKAPQVISSSVTSYGFADFLETFHAWQTMIAGDPSSVYHSSLGMTSAGVKLHMTQLAEEPPVELEVRAKPLHNFQQNYSYPEFVLANSGFADSVAEPSGLALLTRLNTTSIYSKYKSFYVDEPLLPEESMALSDLFWYMPDSVTVEFFMEGGVISSVPANATAFSHRTRHIFHVQVWHTEVEEDLPNRDKGEAWVEKFFEQTRAMFGHSESYQNYVDQDMPDALRRYYGENLERLIQIKLKYDPNNYFWNPQSIPTTLADL